jgi:hypothetical protein
VECSLVGDIICHECDVIYNGAVVDEFPENSSSFINPLCSDKMIWKRGDTLSKLNKELFEIHDLDFKKSW